ncbi:MAG: hypothetical protein QM769_00805 [Pseudoxanthomonas sp.]
MSRAAVQAVTLESVQRHAGGSFGAGERLLGELLELFPLPTPEVVLPFLISLRRILAHVPWAEEAFDAPNLDADLAQILGQLRRVGHEDRLTVRKQLKGDFDLAGTLLGVEQQPMPGPESLRAALWACRMRWGKGRKSAVEKMSSVIRGVVLSRDAQAADMHALVPLLPSLGAAQTLGDFIEVARVLETCGHRTLAEVWRHDFGPELERIAQSESHDLKPKSALGVQGPEPNSPLSVLDSIWVEPDPAEDDGAVDKLTRAIRLAIAKTDGEPVELEPGEPLEESVGTIVVGAIPPAQSNPDARNLARYIARQALWTSNYLLLTQHADVLPWPEYRLVVGQLLQELRDPAQAAPYLKGLLALLLQAITGRSTRTLTAFWLSHSQGEPEPAGACVVSLEPGQLKLKVLWRNVVAEADAETGPEAEGFFQPNPDQSAFFELVTDAIRLPLPPPIVEILKGHAAWLACLHTASPAALEAEIRSAARYLGEKLGMTLVAGQIRRSFAVHFFEMHRDTALTQLVCADTLGLSEAPLHYYAPRSDAVSEAYWTLLQELLGLALPFPKGFKNSQRTGAASLATDAAARSLAAPSGGELHRGVDQLLAEGRWRDVHKAMVNHLACMFLVVAGHRPVNALFRLTIEDLDLDREAGIGLFSDKKHDVAHNPRFAALAPCLVRQIHAYLEHLRGMAEREHSLVPHIRAILSGESPLLFGIDADGQPVDLAIGSWRRSLPSAWLNMPLNWGRAWIRTRAIELGLPPEWAAVQVGHLEAVGYPFSNASPAVPREAALVIAPHLERMAKVQGWRVHRGIRPQASDGSDNGWLPPLKSWKAEVHAHEADARQVAKQWRELQRSRIRSLRARAEADVLAHPVIVARGIDAAFRVPVGPWNTTSLTRVEAEAVRDDLFESADEDPALGLARTEALRRVLKCVNRRIGRVGQEPASLQMFRRPLDNAFVPGMMTALRQIRELREHACELGAKPPGDWRDFPRACARVAYALAVFGYVDNPAQIEGVLRHRHRLQAASTFPDAVFVPWGDAPDQVIVARGLAGLAIARLASKYPEQFPVSDRESLNKALRGFLPGWALASSATDANTDVLSLLCETGAIANRIELSPAARFALDARDGSTNARIEEQIALIDGDPVGTLARTWEAPLSGDESPDSALPASQSKGNARAQYLALCRILPLQGHDLELPLTDTKVSAEALELFSTRQRVIAEVDAMLAERTPNRMLQLVVHLLALWVRQMLDEGTEARKNPADSTIRTYLTRIGGGLVEVLGNSSLVDLDEGELEDAYLAIIESQAASRDKAAAAILSFHACCERHFDMPEVDFSEVRAYLRVDGTQADANLILPLERDEIVRQASIQAQGSGSQAIEEVRLSRQVEAVMPVFAYNGTRRGEALGIRHADVFHHQGDSWISIRGNRSRRLKTRASRRTVLLLGTTHGAQAFANWVESDGARVPKWKRDRAYVFSPINRPTGATGRHAVAVRCNRLIAQVTGRGHERIHRFRHLVGFERITPGMLSVQDYERLSRTTLSGSQAPGAQRPWLPRDVLEQVAPLGHVHWRTTLRSYYHFPWLLRSRPDAVVTSQYVGRRGVAFAMGVTVTAADRIVQLEKVRQPIEAWFDHVRSPRQVPLAKPVSERTDSPGKRAWKAVELLQLFDMTEQVGNLEEALLISGGRMDDVAPIRASLSLVEQRLGHRLIKERPGPGVRSRRTIRRIEAAGGFDLLCAWFDQGAENRRDTIRKVAGEVMEWASPEHGNVIRAPAIALNALEELLLELGIDGGQIMRIEDGSGISGLRVLARGNEDVSKSEPRVKEKRFLGLPLKRVLATVWMAARFFSLER